MVITKPSHGLLFALVALASACASMSNRPPAEARLVDACDAGDLAACTDLGDRLIASGAAPGSGDRAIDRYLRSCEGGHARGCARAGLTYATGHGVPAHLATAARYFERACDAGHGLYGCVELARLALEGAGVLHDDARAARLASRGCEAGDPAGCGLVGEMTRSGRGVTRDPAAGLRLLERACEGRDGDGCVALAEAYADGVDAPLDQSRAVRALERGCAAGHLVSCHVLGLRLERGDGVERDDARAAALALRACTGGVAGACTDLGAAYLNGAGVGRDPIEAARRFDRACALGDALGCRARLVVRDARVGGRGVGLTPALLDVELARSIDAVAACRRRSASARSAAVSVTVRFIVDPEGAVAAAARLGGTGAQDDVAECVTSVLRGARFAQPEGGRERIFDAQFHLSDDDAPPFVTATPTTADAPPPAVAAAPSDGLLSPALIRATTVAHLGEVVACHERGLAAQPDASGQVVVRFVIAGDGVVASSVVTRSTYPLPWVARCVADAVRGWRFPRPSGGGVVTVNYPFNLQLPEPDAP